MCAPVTMDILEEVAKSNDVDFKMLNINSQQSKRVYLRGGALLRRFRFFESVESLLECEYDSPSGAGDASRIRPLDCGGCNSISTFSPGAVLM
jgi:hypothetical protein